MVSASADLKPCPFCGSKRAELAEFSGGSQGGYDGGFYVHCLDCEASGPRIVEWNNNAKQRVLDHWNMRTAVPM